MMKFALLDRLLQLAIMMVTGTEFIVWLTVHRDRTNPTAANRYRLFDALLNKNKTSFTWTTLDFIKNYDKTIRYVVSST